MALVPQGLVLLLSLAQAVAVIRLGRQKVLVQQLQAVETLARVTLLATDKTGTLTTGAVVLDNVHVARRTTSPVDAALGCAGRRRSAPRRRRSPPSARRDPDPTGWAVRDRIPFASAYKYSAVDFHARGGVVPRARPEVLLGARHAGARAGPDPRRCRDARARRRQGGGGLQPAGTVPTDLVAAALVVCADEIRPDAADTIAYFQAENVVTKVISGDNPRTVSAIAGRCGIPSSTSWIDARDMDSDDAGGSRPRPAASPCSGG